MNLALWGNDPKTCGSRAESLDGLFEFIKMVTSREGGARASLLRVMHLPFESANPYQELLARALGEQGVDVDFRPWKWWITPDVIRNGVDGVHFHWLHYWAFRTAPVKFAFAWMAFGIQLLLLKALGRRIFWTVHNIQDHEARAPIRELLMGRLVSKLSNQVFVHSCAARDEVRKRMGVPDRKITVIPHGTYEGVYPNHISRESSRNELGISGDECLFLFLGQVRAYKGVVDLIRTFHGASLPNARLIVAGRVHGLYRDEVQRACEGVQNVEVHDQFVADDRIQIYLNAADVVVFPYREIVTSGALVLAMSFGCACLVPEIPAMKEVLGADSGFYYSLSDDDGLARCLEEAAGSPEKRRRYRDGSLQRSRLWSWARVARETRHAYENAG